MSSLALNIHLSIFHDYYVKFNTSNTLISKADDFELPLNLMITVCGALGARLKYRDGKNGRDSFEVPANTIRLLKAFIKDLASFHVNLQMADFQRMALSGSC
jgi:hypothetical protein